MVDDVQPELQAALRKIKLLEEGLRQAERLRKMFDQTAQELKATKAQLLQQHAELEEKMQERTKQLLASQEELVRTEKLSVLGKVADSVGHELRNPLGVMNNAVYFLQSVLSGADDTTKEYLGIIKDEIGNADRIVGDLLDAVRTKPPQLQVVDVIEIIEQALSKCVVSPSVHIVVDMPVALPTIQVDPLQMQQVFRNLISNGIDAMPQGGELKIRAEEDKPANTIKVSIRDTGTGIAPEQMSRLFQPLFTTKSRGIGLGLMVVKNLTQANGGKVEAQSEVGKGTVFTITLPIDPLPSETAETKVAL